MTGLDADLRVAHAARVLVSDHFCTRRDESVLITADAATDRALVTALIDAAVAVDARPAVITIPRLPFQGTLADPFIADPVRLAVQHCDVWFDLTFPYMAGSHAYDAAMAAKRPRYILIGDLGAAGLGRLYGTVDFDQLFEVQSAIDALFARSEGAACRVTTPAGTDLRFTLGKPATKKTRHANTPGSQTVPGSAMVFPIPETVRGTVVLEAAFHEYYGHLGSPIVLIVDGRIREIRGDGPEVAVMDRSLRRAGGGDYGYVIHLSHAFHPSARFAGSSFIEDIRAVGNNAVGLGLPWWVPGGGENHPDGVVTRQSMWIGDVPVVEAGVLRQPPEAASLLATLLPD
jgi:2,5-dihydroxypyridine 5,6-dioxygenase